MVNIFISSTYNDLKGYREKVSSVVRKMNHSDIAMEYFVAEDKRPLDKCLEEVSSCDLYIGIFAWRYGSVPIEKEKSITELEYRKARDSEKPCLIFLLKEDEPWSPIIIDDDRTKINALRKELCENHTVDFFTSIDSLGERVTIAIQKWDEDKNVFGAPKKDQELNVEAYYKAILLKYNVLDLDALTPPEKADFIEIQLRSVFVEQDVREDTPPIEMPKELMEKLIKDEKFTEDDLPKGITSEEIKIAKKTYIKKPALPVLDVISKSDNHKLVILGDPGAGKSILSRFLVLSIISKDERYLDKSFLDYLPLLIELRDYAAECSRNKCNTFIEYLDFLGKTKGYGLKKKSLEDYLINGKSLVIFDGLDEIFDPEQRESIEQQIIWFSINYPKTRIIITSRIVGYKRRILTNAGFSHYTLQDLHKPQINSFIDKWYNIALVNPDEARARKKRINRAIEESASIKQLAGNPLLLTIMAIINKHQELPRERWRLYEFASSVLIYHWDWERKISEWNIKIEYVDKADKEELLRRIAYTMQSAPKGLAGNYIHAEILKQKFEKYFRDRYQKNPTDAKLASQALIEQLRERNFILCRYGSNLYGFIHRTFLEYFCAWSIVWKFNIKHEFDIENLKNIFEEHWGDEDWHEVLRLICGMIDEKFAEILIDYLMQSPPSAFDEIRKLESKFPKTFYMVLHNDGIDPGWEKIMFDSVWEVKRIDLAIKCMGEIRNIESIRSTSSKLLMKTLELISEPKTSYFEQDIFSSALSLGERWAGREKLKYWISNIHKFDNKEFESDWFLGRRSNNIGMLIGTLGAGDKSIRASINSLLESDSLNSKNIAFSALAFGWQDDPETLKLLKEYALKNSNELVRETAISIIGQKWWNKDSETLSLLIDCALTDKSLNIRNAAIQVIVDNNNNSLDVLPFLCQLAKSASEIDIRKFALLQIGKPWKNDIKTLELIKDRAVNDAYYGVRLLAVSFLKENWIEEPDVLNILHDRVLKEQNPAVQKIIYEILNAKDA